MNKPQLTNNQFLLVLHGPSCAGKSTISDIIFKQYGGIFKGKSDTIKRLISDYDYPTHRDMVGEMTLATMKIALAHGLSVLKEGGLYGLPELVSISKETQVPLFMVNIAAPWEVLLERFQVRKENPLPNVKINTDTTRFKEVYDEYLATKMETPLEFDSSKQTPEEIVATIVARIKKHFEN